MRQGIGFGLLSTIPSYLAGAFVLGLLAAPAGFTAGAARARPKLPQVSGASSNG